VSTQNQVPPHALVPDPLASLEQLERYRGDDIPGLTPRQAIDEAAELLAHLQHLIDDDDDPVVAVEPVRAHDWIRARIRALIAHGFAAPGGDEHAG
jgi:hypothetical protein